MKIKAKRVRKPEFLPSRLPGAKIPDGAILKHQCLDCKVKLEYWEEAYDWTGLDGAYCQPCYLTLLDNYEEK